LNNPAIKIGITIGDPAGIGPEVTLKAITKLRGHDLTPVVIGRADVLQKYFPDFLREFIIIRKEKIVPSDILPYKKYIIDIASKNPVPSPGRGSIATGLESRIYIDKAVDLWKQDIVNAIVTGPVSKAYIEKSGCRFTGHTEYIAKLINEENPYMMMYSPHYRVLLVTTHIPVADIPGMINTEKIYNTILTGHKAIKTLDDKNAKIAIAGLDPHCGDEGAIGNFDIEITGKAIQRALKDGVDIEGPFAADTLFTPQKWKAYNLAIAHYHDQGLIPFKVLAFDSGVNVTLGLSIIRTSPDHGTAYDIAGQNRANHKSMLEAIKLACRLARKKSG
jgi:4-phospho-D-threonate 3-dehydrogenase / 4-phospho-D-erythronate 3-dehydrogenase